MRHINIRLFKKKKIQNEKGDLIISISKLPLEIQKKIYIVCFRNYWRTYIPLTAQVPTWYHRKIRIEKEIYDSREENIHFLHLSFNCIPERNTYILGCQCKTCKKMRDCNLLDHHVILKNQLLNYKTFKKNMPQSQFSLNSYYRVLGETLHKNFDPLFDTMYEDYTRQGIRKNYPKFNFAI